MFWWDGATLTSDLMIITTLLAGIVRHVSFMAEEA